MRRVQPDGMETCEYCEASVFVWKEDDGKRVFETHYGKVGYPATCAGVPAQEVNP